MSTVGQLFCRMKSLSFSDEWILEIDGPCGNGMISRNFSFGSVKIIISQSFCWSLSINDTKVHLPEHSPVVIHEVLDTCEKVVELLRQAEQCNLCVGNPDDKFVNVSKKRKGKFVNHQGQ